MFEEVTLTNFQCHKHLTLKLDKITTLVGLSDSGKSTVLRAISWVCYNTGTAKSYLNNEDKSSEVSVTLKIDGHTITRTSELNSYIVDKKPYNTIGQKMPDDVVRLLRMGSDNLQSQYDTVYWFNDTGSAIASKLNKVVDLSKLDEWVNNGVSAIRSKRSFISGHIVARDSFAEKIEYGQQYYDADRELSVLEDLCKKIQEKQTVCKEIEDTLIALQSINHQINRKDELIGDLSVIIKECEDIVAKQRDIQNIGGVLREYDEISDRCGKLSDVLSVKLDFDGYIAKKERYDKLGSLVLSIINTEKKCACYNNISSLVSECDRIIELLKNYTSVHSILSEISDTDNLMALCDGKIEKQKDELSRLSKGRCPTCGQVVDGVYCCADH